MVQMNHLKGPPQWWLLNFVLKLLYPPPNPYQVWRKLVKRTIPPSKCGSFLYMQLTSQLLLAYELPLFMIQKLISSIYGSHWSSQTNSLHSLIEYVT